MAARNDEKRNEILKVAFDLFTDSDYGKVSLADIAASADINKSLLQHYYPQRKNIIESMLEELLEKSYNYMLSADSDDLFQKISDFNMLFFKTASKNKKLNRFIVVSVSNHELMELWIDIICRWLRDICGEDTFSYLQLRTAISFSMTGSMYLYLHKDELNLNYKYILENHFRSIIIMLGISFERRDEICATTRIRTDDFNTDRFIEFCNKNIKWINL
jgi:AcrR family transcriptional regulator